MPRPITFLSDYGTSDEFVGVVHAVIAHECPTARVIDLSHGVPRQSVLAGALMLRRALPYAPPGVHLAIVDPEVGARRRAVALRTALEDRILVGPDNGLLLPAAERFGWVTEAVEISTSPCQLIAHAMVVDGYGNVQLDAAPDDLQARIGREVAIGADGRIARYLRTFADAGPGELLLYEDAAGMLALAVNGGEASTELGGVAPGDELRLTPS